MYGQGGNFSTWLCGIGGFMPGPLGMIMTVILWGLALVLAFKAIQYLFSWSVKGKSIRSLNILKERYAAGELNKSEFEQMKRDIS